MFLKRSIRLVSLLIGILHTPAAAQDAAVMRLRALVDAEDGSKTSITVSPPGTRPAGFEIREN